jgi:hypothetical protein
MIFDLKKRGSLDNCPVFIDTVFPAIPVKNHEEQ